MPNTAPVTDEQQEGVCALDAAVVHPYWTGTCRASLLTRISIKTLAPTLEVEGSAMAFENFPAHPM
jgi:hypothetical protein